MQVQYVREFPYCLIRDLPYSHYFPDVYMGDLFKVRYDVILNGRVEYDDVPNPRAVSTFGVSILKLRLDRFS